MTQEQFWRACYRTITLILVAPEHGARPQPARSETDPAGAGHLLWMLQEATLFYTAGKVEKANRWLGYAQGVIAAKGWATLEELKRANMPDGETFDGERV